MYIVKPKPDPQNLEASYDYYNAMYFDGELEPIGSIKFSSRLRRNLGKTYLDSDVVGTTKIHVRILESLAQNPEKLERTLVHEMVHVKNLQRYLRCQDPSYLDEFPQNGYEFDSPGHGRYFFEEAERLNQEFDHLEIQAKEPLYVTEYMLRRKYLYMIVTLRGDGGSDTRHAVYYFDGKDQDHRISKIQHQLRDVYGLSLKEAALYATESPNVAAYSRMCKDFSLRKNQVPSYYAHDEILKLSDIESRLVDSCTFSSKTTELHYSLYNALYQLRSSRHLPFSEYLLLAVNRLDCLKEFRVGNEIMSYSALLLAGEHEAVKMLHSDWKNVKSSEIEKSQLFHELMEDMGRAEVTPVQHAKKAMVGWQDFGTRRITLREFIKVIENSAPYNLSTTSLEEIKRELRNIASDKTNFDVCKNSSGFIGEDVNTFVSVCCLEKLNQGLQVRAADVEAYNEMWARPELSNVMLSLRMAGDLDKISNEIVQEYLINGRHSAARQLDHIVAGWSDFAKRGVSISALRDEVVKSISTRVEDVMSKRSRHWVQTKELGEFPGYLSAQLEASVSHCYGSKNPMFRQRKVEVKGQNQMDLF